MQTKEQTNLTSWDDHMDAKYGKPGTVVREQWEQQFEVFKLEVLLEEAKEIGHTSLNCDDDN